MFVELLLISYQHIDLACYLSEEFETVIFQNKWKVYKIADVSFDRGRGWKIRIIGSNVVVCKPKEYIIYLYN